MQSRHAPDGWSAAAGLLACQGSCSKHASAMLCMPQNLCTRARSRTGPQGVPLLDSAGLVWSSSPPRCATARSSWSTPRNPWPECSPACRLRSGSSAQGPITSPTTSQASVLPHRASTGYLPAQPGCPTHLFVKRHHAHDAPSVVPPQHTDTANRRHGGAEGQAALEPTPRIACSVCMQDADRACCWSEPDLWSGWAVDQRRQCTSSQAGRGAATPTNHGRNEGGPGARRGSAPRPNAWLAGRAADPQQVRGRALRPAGVTPTRGRMHKCTSQACLRGA